MFINKRWSMALILKVVTYIDLFSLSSTSAAVATYEHLIIEAFMFEIVVMTILIVDDDCGGGGDDRLASIGLCICMCLYVCACMRASMCVSERERMGPGVSASSAPARE